MKFTDFSLFSCLHGPHQFPFPASKFIVVLAIWFGFLTVETQHSYLAPFIKGFYETFLTGSELKWRDSTGIFCSED